MCTFCCATLLCPSNLYCPARVLLPLAYHIQQASFFLWINGVCIAWCVCCRRGQRSYMDPPLSPQDEHLVEGHFVPSVVQDLVSSKQVVGEAG
jgi:hypothetical protein